MTLTARGAEEPVIRADNMRLDVALLPLLSHQLQVKQVMLKGAVIQLTPKTEAVRDSSAPVVPHDNTLPLAQRIADGPTMCVSCRWPTTCSSSSMRAASR